MNNGSDAQRLKKILIIRSAPTWLFEKAVEKLMSGNEKPVIDVYCPQIISAQLQSDKRFHAIIDDNWDGFFCWSSMTGSLVRKLTENKYDKVVILYNDIFGEDHGALRRLAFKIKPCKVVSLNTNITWSRLNGEGALRRFFLPHKWVYSAMILLFTLEIIALTFLDWLRYKLHIHALIKVRLPQKHKR